MKRYILKEYGAWGVMLMAYAAGLVVSRGFNVRALAALFALALLINAKQSFVLWMRSAAGMKKVPSAVFLAQIVLATALLAGVSEQAADGISGEAAGARARWNRGRGAGVGTSEHQSDGRELRFRSS